MLSLFSAAPAFVPGAALPAPHAVAHAGAAAIQMDGAKGGSFAPEGMGKDYALGKREPLSAYVGASQELSSFPGATPGIPWDPFMLSQLSGVSGNNPDTAWLREAELKHGRIAMLAFAGVLATSGGMHLPGDLFTDPNWTTAWDSVSAKSPAATGQIVATIGIIEGQTSEGISDLWFGKTDKRTPGDIGFDPLNLMPTTPEAADKMKLKELKNGRMAMIAMAGFASNHFIPGAVPGLGGYA